MKTIIVATDYSKDAANAVDYAGGLAKQCNARLVLFNSFMLSVHASNTLLSSNAYEKILTGNKLLLEQMAQKLKEKYAIEVLWEAADSDFKEQLEFLMKKYQASLLVMGSRGDSLEQKLLGNTTTSMIKNFKYPILAVPRDAKFTEVKQLLFACDYTCRFVDNTLAALKDLFADINAKVEVFHVDSDIKTDNTKTPSDLLELAEKGLIEFKVVKGLHILKNIREEIKAIGADILVMVPQKYKFWDSILHVSKTGVMASNGKVPLLSVPNDL